MKINAVSDQANFQHNAMTKPGKLTNLLYSALFSASLLSATTSDTFKKSEDVMPENIVQVEPQKAQYGETQRVINNAFGKKSNSDFGLWIMLGAAALVGFIHSTFFDGKQQH